MIVQYGLHTIVVQVLVYIMLYSLFYFSCEARWFGGIMKKYILALFVVVGSCLSGFGDNAEMLQKIRQYAEKGNAVAQYNLGLIYEEGKYLGKDDVEAEKWYFLAHRQGHLESTYRIGELYYAKHLKLGVYGSSHLSRARIWHRRAAWQGHVGAKTRVREDLVKVRKYLADQEEKSLLREKEEALAGGGLGIGLNQWNAESQAARTEKKGAVENKKKSKRRYLTDEEWNDIRTRPEQIVIQPTAMPHSTAGLSRASKEYLGYENSGEGVGNEFGENFEKSNIKARGVLVIYVVIGLFFAMSIFSKGPHDRPLPARNNPVAYFVFSIFLWPLILIARVLVFFVR